MAASQQNITESPFPVPPPTPQGGKEDYLTCRKLKKTIVLQQVEK